MGRAGVRRYRAVTYIIPRLTLARTAALFAVLFIALLLRTSELGTKGIGHYYYGGTVLSMMQSPSNFVFGAAEPGGSITVDKPPLGFMTQAVAAWIFGFNWVSLALPGVISGVLTTTLVHAMIARRFGFWPGTLAALVVAVTPVSVALDRTNLIDSQMILAQTIGVAFGLRAIETGRLRPLLWSALAFGAAFNIKMLQSVFPLPPLILVYLLSAPAPWAARLRRLAITGVVYGVVAFSWAVAVDLTPPDSRPFIGSSGNNSAFDLIFGYNGLMRTSGATALIGGPTASTGIQAFIESPTRLFDSDLFYNAGWMLPLAVGIAVIGILAWRPRRAAEEPFRALLLYGSWLLIGGYVLTVASFIHAYYSIILMVPAAALIGIGAWWAVQSRRGALIWAAGISLLLVYQHIKPFDDGYPPVWWPLTAVLAVAGIAAWRMRRIVLTVGFGAVAIVITPFVFSGLTSSMALDRTVPEPFGTFPTRIWLTFHDIERLDYNPDALAFLQAETQGIEYMVAVPNAAIGSPYVIHSGRPVLFIGGFIGRDSMISDAGIAQMIADGRVRYLYLPDSATAFRPELRVWAAENCRLVFGVDLSAPRWEMRNGTPTRIWGAPRGIDSLFDCFP
ncbi:MAG: putative glycosyltransferase [Chloroflexota bacterium]|nr:MAG: putative glycosyltransferase [Chloroflexota bacterium]